MSHSLPTKYHDQSRYTLGLDISHHNYPVDFEKLYKQNFRYVTIKATEGTTFQDPKYHEYVEDAQSAGMLVRPYHFFRPTGDAVEQYHYFMNYVDANRVLEDLLQSGLDLELDSNERDVNELSSPKAYVAGADAWIDQMEDEMDEYPVLYTYKNFFRWAGSPQQWGKTYLWIAAYNDVPEILPGWHDWNCWQYTDGTDPAHAHIDGVSGESPDLDVFNGSINDLRRYVL